MAAVLIEPPASEPLALNEAKNYLRVAHDADDALITSMIAAARIQVETRTRRALITQTWRVMLDRWPASGAVVSPVSPLREIVAARVRNGAGEAEELDADIFIAGTASSPGLIAFDAGRVTQPSQEIAGIEIDIEAGYGAAADIPAPLVQAIRLLLARAYEFRGQGTRDDAMPEGIAELLAQYRVVSL
ncbi:MAG: head-tail connector protein [Xanthobacteraceae bacterium]|nr:head-tail connector protein [Xanthobacteraceae bacterium]